MLLLLLLVVSSQLAVQVRDLQSAALQRCLVLTDRFSTAGGSGLLVVRLPTAAGGATSPAPETLEAPPASVERRGRRDQTRRQMVDEPFH